MQAIIWHVIVVITSNSSCCGNIVRLEDLVGKKIEFRKFSDLAPQIGTKWECPSCYTLYFVYWKREDQFWTNPADAQQTQFLDSQGQTYYNEHQGRFVYKQSGGTMKDTGYFSLILVYYYPLSEQVEWSNCNQDKETQLINYYPDFLDC